MPLSSGCLIHVSFSILKVQYLLCEVAAFLGVRKHYSQITIKMIFYVRHIYNFYLKLFSSYLRLFKKKNVKALQLPDNLTNCQTGIR